MIETSKTAQDSGGGLRRVLWTLDGTHVRPLKVRVGASDGIVTEVEGNGLTEGMLIVTGLRSGSSASSEARNPFAPQFPGRSRSQGAR